MVSTRRPYKVGIARRALILSVARGVFSSDGFHATTLESIARAADMSPSSLKHYYPTKHHILAALVDQQLTEFDERDSDPGDIDVYTWLNNMREAHEQIASDQAGTELSVLALSEATDPSSPFHDRMRSQYERAVAHGASVLRACQERGEVRADVDPNHIAALALAMPNGLQQAWLLQDHGNDLATLSNSWLAMLATAIITPEYLDGERINALATPID